MSTPLVVVGAGGFGRETLDVLVAINADSDEPVFELLGVLDDAPSERNLERLTARGIGYLGTVEKWLDSGDRADYLVAVGHPSTRRALAQRFESCGYSPATAVHPTAVIGSAAVVGRGSIICGGVQVSTNVHLGSHVHLNPNATIGHDVAIADYVSINPAVTISGECVIQEGALLGSGAVVLQGVTVSVDAVVGAAACVLHDVSEGTVVKGVPAR